MQTNSTQKKIICTYMATQLLQLMSNSLAKFEVKEDEADKEEC